MSESKPLDPAVIKTLSAVTTATITTILLKKGLRNVWMRGARPLKPGQPRLVGRAFTLRFVPAREDLATPESWSSPISTRAAIEAMPAGCIAVADAMGITDAGIFGDILCARMQKKGVAALITDGVVRDVAGVLGTGLPVWCQGGAAPPSVASRCPRCGRARWSSTCRQRDAPAPRSGNRRRHPHPFFDASYLALVSAFIG
jgi:regulator of RNase E activity RraA